MMRKTSFYKRKIKGISSVIFLSIVIFLGVFAVCIGSWMLFKNHVNFKSPLARVLGSKNNDTLISKIQNQCITNHLDCVNVVINSDNTITVTLQISGFMPQAILSLEKDMNEQLSSLQLTIADLTIKNKRFSRVDFRYDKPIIVY